MHALINSPIFMMWLGSSIFSWTSSLPLISVFADAGWTAETGKMVEFKIAPASRIENRNEICWEEKLEFTIAQNSRTENCWASRLRIAEKSWEISGDAIGWELRKLEILMMISWLCNKKIWRDAEEAYSQIGEDIYWAKARHMRSYLSQFENQGPIICLIYIH